MRAFTVLDCPQRSPQWFAARCGRLCGSHANDMLATIAKGEAAGRRKLRAKLVLERLTGKSQERGFQSQAMQDGVEREADAAATYEAVTGRILTFTGYLAHNEHLAGCSLDGHVGDFEGIAEIKCPEPHTHLDYLRSGLVPTDYYRQVLHNLWITGAAWCDWLSYHPDFPTHLQVKLVRIQRDQTAIDDYARKAIAFLAEVSAEVKQVGLIEETAL